MVTDIYRTNSQVVLDLVKERAAHLGADDQLVPDATGPHDNDNDNDSVHNKVQGEIRYDNLQCIHPLINMHLS